MEARPAGAMAGGEDVAKPGHVDAGAHEDVEEPRVWDALFPDGMGVLDEPFVPRGAGGASAAPLGVVNFSLCYLW